MRKENGVWHFKENWFLNYIWRTNFRYFIHKKFIKKHNLLEAIFLLDNNYKKPKTPNNLCHLVRGSVVSPFFIPLWFLMTIICSSFMTAVLFLLLAMAAFIGFYINPIIDNENTTEYKYWGKKRIPVAAWEICLPVAVIYLLVKYHELIAVGTVGVVSLV